MELKRVNQLIRDTKVYLLDLKGGQARITAADVPSIPKLTVVEIVQGPMFVLDGKGQTHMVVKIRYATASPDELQAWVLASAIELSLADKKI